MLKKAQVIPVNIPSTLSLKISNKEFVELASANRDLRLERTAEGELIVIWFCITVLIPKRSGRGSVG